ncbi:DNA mismatch endonuclease (patch repair protein) [Roseovarius sp. MBR-38]|jgi:DNA mismatch endonuclease (patch repair protein)|uniref:very short patch repair endonuclease n=1 Tax=Roseovarius sp. MBR-78 TaxID=3156460 RepID=UPI0033945AD8
MAAIHGKDTKPEMLLRRALHAMGFRYRLHDRRLPGRPDLVFPQYRAVVFVNGCFWHGHQCDQFRWPNSREEFWRAKIGGNAARDDLNIASLHNVGWRVGVVWECAVKGKWRLGADAVVDAVAGWLSSDRRDLVVQGGSRQDANI